MTPRFSISEISTFRASFDEDVRAYSQAGADGIGIWEYKLQRGRDEESLGLMRASGLAAAICVPEVPSILPDAFFTKPTDPLERRAALCASLRRLAPFKPDGILCVLGGPDLYEPAEQRRIIVDGMRAVADVAGEVGLRIGLEFYRKTSGSFLSTLADTLELADEVGRPNVGVIADAWHFWDEPDVIARLSSNVKRLVGVQVGDWRNPTRGWADRVITGDGSIDFPSIFGALDAAGYDGWYEVEIFSDNGQYGDAYPDSLWDLDTLEVAQRAVAGFRQTWERRRTAAASDKGG